MSILLGSGIVVGSLFFESVELPDDLDDRLSQNSTVYYSDGTTEMAALGVENRRTISLEEIPDHLQWALIAAEDKQFYDHSGVDFWGVMRALWNNVTGGSTQGASTLTQQYVGQVADIRGDDSYLRKAREAVMAMKMDQNFTKAEILGHYLNLVYFGRGAYGVEAAAQAFFGKPAKDLDVDQSALLIAQIKSPDGSMDPRDPLGLGPTQVREAAFDRWSYVLDGLVKLGELSKSQRSELIEIPATVNPEKFHDNSNSDSPTGLISHKYVLQELRDAGISPDKVMSGGYKIVTTIDADLQETVHSSGIREVGADDDHLAAGLTAVEPETGRVLAYYGGESGTGADAAGQDAMHPPGTSFNVVPAIAAINGGASPGSQWDGSSPREFDSRTDADGGKRPLLNTGGANKSPVSLAGAVYDKLDTPMYAIAEKYGTDTLLAVAGDLGLNELADPNNADDSGVAPVIDISKETTKIEPEFSLGAYPISVKDSATMYATLAGQGTAAQSHFVASVTGSDGESIYSADPDITKESVQPEIANSVTSILGGLEGPAPSAEPDWGQPRAVNASPTWFSGYIPQLAVSVWAGDDRHEGDGSSPQDTLAEKIWMNFMDSATERYPDPESFPPVAPVGSDDAGELPVA